VASSSSNPYLPPEDSIEPVTRTSSLVASFLVTALFLVLCLRAFRATIYLGVMSPWDSLRDAATWLTPETLGVSWAVSRPFLALAIVSFCIWIYRANRDARTLGVTDMTFSPPWAVAVGFIPVVNLIGPYRAVKEIHQASSYHTRGSGGSSWRGAPVPWLLPLWWGVWIASLAWNLVPYTTLTPMSAVWGQAILELLRAGAALLLIVVVLGIERHQAASELNRVEPRRD
jgi:hypothetical protein